MFEQRVLYYLQQYLGKYVAGLDADALRISVLAGDVVLRNLQLKPEALSKLKLPITVKAGLLGSLKLKVGCHDAAVHVSR
jgi:N-terminal region of Chorein or VPS13